MVEIVLLTIIKKAVERQPFLFSYYGNVNDYCVPAGKLPTNQDKRVLQGIIDGMNGAVS